MKTDRRTLLGMIGAMTLIPLAPGAAAPLPCLGNVLNFRGYPIPPLPTYEQWKADPDCFRPGLYRHENGTIYNHFYRDGWSWLEEYRGA